MASGTVRHAGVIIAVLGGIVSGALGLTWLRDVARYELGSHFVDVREVEQLSWAGYALVLALVAASVSAVLAVHGRRKIAGTTLLVAGLAPGLLDLRAFIATWLLILAGVLLHGHREDGPTFLHRSEPTPR